MERTCKKSGLGGEKQGQLMKMLAQKETEFIRLRRRRINAECFDTVKIIGRGAFGEVRRGEKRIQKSFEKIFYRDFSSFPPL